MKQIHQPKRLRFVGIAFVIAAMVAGTANLTSAHQGAKGIVKERMDLMSSVANQLKKIVQMVQGKVPFDAKAASEAANAIATHADQALKLFPKGSGGHPSEAKDEVWKNWDEFVKRSQDMGSAARALAGKADAAKNKSDIVLEFKQLAATCSSCHSKFRVKK